jgi:hypothetical protein
MDIGELIWILIVVYVLYRLFFQPSKPGQKNRYEVPSEPSQEEDRSSTRTRDEILDELRTIFGDESTTKKPEAKPTPARRAKTREESADAGQSGYASYTGTDFIDTRGQMSEADRALENVTFESRSLMDEKSSRGPSFSYLFEPSEIRKGIIISEILGKPKSRRRQNI